MMFWGRRGITDTDMNTIGLKTLAIDMQLRG